MNWKAVKRAFGFIAARWAASHGGQEAVALIGVTANEKYLIATLANEAKGRRQFLVRMTTIEHWAKRLAKRGAVRLILAHSHVDGRGAPSNMMAGGDVQWLGCASWRDQANALLERLGMQGPFLHMIHVLNTDIFRVFVIDDRIGKWVRRKRHKKWITIRIGWREVMP